MSISSAQHVRALDGVRGLAVLLVMVLHFTLIQQPQAGLESLFTRTMFTGWIGVDLFFVLSGFLITGILYDAKNGAHFFRNFYLRRALRIFPLYYAFLLLILVIVPRVSPGAMQKLDGAPWLWTYTGNFYFATKGWEGMPEHSIHLWSLAVEEQFYLLWPFVVYFLDRARLLRFSLAVIVGATLFRVGMQFLPAGSVAAYALLPARMDGLALGGALALVLRGDDGLERSGQLARQLLLSAVLVLGAAVGWSIAFHPLDSWLPALAPHVQILGYLGTALASGALILFAVGRTPPTLHRVLTSRAFVMLGKYSYALYMIHVPIRDLLRSWDVTSNGLPRVAGSQLPAQLAIYCFGILASLLLALVSWQVFEKHFLRLKALFPYGAPAGGKTAGETYPQPAPVAD